MLTDADVQTHSPKSALEVGNAKFGNGNSHLAEGNALLSEIEIELASRSAVNEPHYAGAALKAHEAAAAYRSGRDAYAKSADAYSAAGEHGKAANAHRAASAAAAACLHLIRAKSAYSCASDAFDAYVVAAREYGAEDAGRAYYAALNAHLDAGKAEIAEARRARADR